MAALLAHTSSEGAARIALIALGVLAGLAIVVVVIGMFFSWLGDFVQSTRRQPLQFLIPAVLSGLIAAALQPNLLLAAGIAVGGGLLGWEIWEEFW